MCQGWGELSHMCAFVLDGVNNVMNRAFKLTICFTSKTLKHISFPIGVCAINNLSSKGP